MAMAPPVKASLIGRSSRVPSALNSTVGSPPEASPAAMSMSPSSFSFRAASL
jgi:hypothetical protein